MKNQQTVDVIALEQFASTKGDIHLFGIRLNLVPVRCVHVSIVSWITNPQKKADAEHLGRHETTLLPFFFSCIL